MERRAGTISRQSKSPAEQRRSFVPEEDSCRAERDTRRSGSDERDYRAPDLAVHRPADVEAQWHPTAALVVEIVSPNDKTWDKLDFYAALGVEELLIVDPQVRAVHWLGLSGGEYRPLERSGLIELSRDDLAAWITWP